jgi:hypothetical protein
MINSVPLSKKKREKMMNNFRSSYGRSHGRLGFLNSERLGGWCACRRDLGKFSLAMAVIYFTWKIGDYISSIAMQCNTSHELSLYETVNKQTNLASQRP